MLLKISCKIHSIPSSCKTRGQTDIYYIYAETGGGGGGEGIKFYLYRKFFFWKKRGGWGFFYEKGSKGEKGTFTRYVDFILFSK